MTIVRLVLLLAAGAGTALLWVSLIHIRRDDVRLSSAVPAVASQSIFSSVQPRRQTAPAATAPAARNAVRRAEVPAAVPAAVRTPAPAAAPAPAPVTAPTPVAA